MQAPSSQNSFVVVVTFLAWSLSSLGSMGLNAQSTDQVAGNAGVLDSLLQSMVTQDASPSRSDTANHDLAMRDRSSDAGRLDDIERRVEELERTVIDASEAEAIAERVVQRYVTQLKVAITQPTGGQRVETVQFQSPSDIYRFSLNPGEAISSYTDPYTGQTVRVGQPTGYTQSVAFQQPVPTWQTEHVLMQASPAPVGTMRTYAMRPVVQNDFTPASSTTTYRRGIFGRQVLRTSASSGPTCQIINGQKVCN